jgi:hypothetical protein
VRAAERGGGRPLPAGRRPVPARRRSLPVVLGLVVAALLAGCAGIPTSGPVRTDPGAGDAPNGRFVRPIPAQPQPGMTPEQVVEGFLAASASFDDDHAVARLFLTADASRGWIPSANVTRVYTQESLTVRPSGAGLEVRAVQSGTITPQGEYVDTPGGTLSAKISLTSVDGEYRISAVPPGLLLDTATVGQAYQSYNIYFTDSKQSVLVPQPVLVPHGPGVSTALVKALLKGPTEWLGPAVRTAIPTDTKLLVDSVPVTQGVAVVDLSEQAAKAVDGQAAAMSAQLVRTLRQVPGVTAVRITVGGAVLRAPGVGDVQSIDSWTSYDPDAAITDRAVFVDKTRLRLLDDGQVEEVPGPAGSGAEPLSSPALSFDGQSVAALSGGGTRVVAGAMAKDGKLAAVISGTSLTAPSYDRFGAVWSVDRTSGGPVVWTAAPGHAAVKVAVAGLPAGRVLALRVSRDGVRVLVLVQGADGKGAAYVGRIDRSDDRPALAGFRALVTPFDDVVQVSWRSSDEVVMLARTAAVTQVAWVGIGGAPGSAPTTYPQPLDASLTAVTATPSDPMLASSDDGRLWTWNGSQWVPAGEGTSPAYAG